MRPFLSCAPTFAASTADTINSEVNRMKNLKALRKARGLSQLELASELGLAQSQVQSYETGAYQPDIQTLVQMADFFETSIDYLVGHTDIRRKIEPVEEYALNAGEQELIAAYRALKGRQRELLALFLQALIGD